MTAATRTATPMPLAHQSAAPWVLSLAANAVLPLAAAPTRRWLRVERGQLWVTAATGTPGPVAREADIWLVPGGSLALPPGSSWLVQAWPEADLVLLQQAPSPARWPAWARRWLSPLFATPGAVYSSPS